MLSLISSWNPDEYLFKLFNYRTMGTSSNIKPMKIIKFNSKMKNILNIKYIQRLFLLYMYWRFWAGIVMEWWLCCNWHFPNNILRLSTRFVTDLGVHHLRHCGERHSWPEVPLYLQISQYSIYKYAVKRNCYLYFLNTMTVQISFPLLCVTCNTF